MMCNGLAYQFGMTEIALKAGIFVYAGGSLLKFNCHTTLSKQTK